MPGARPSGFKQGGGFLNNVDAVITDYEFTDQFPGADGDKPRKGGKSSDFNPLYCVMSFQVDGADEPSQTTLFVGSSDDFEIEGDGKTLVPVDAENGLRANASFSKFINSLCEHGFPDTSLSEDEINFEPILGTRVRLVQVTDVEATKRLGKKKGKDGKEYDRKDLMVSEVYALPGKGGSAGKSASNGKVTPKGKPNGKVEVDIDELATETLTKILDSKGGKIQKSKLPVEIAKALGPKHPQREEVRKRIYDDDFLGLENGWTYDQSSKQQMIELS